MSSKSGLAAAADANQGDELPGGNVQVDVLQRGDAGAVTPVFVAEAADVDAVGVCANGGGWNRQGVLLVAI